MTHAYSLSTLTYYLNKSPSVKYRGACYVGYITAQNTMHSDLIIFSHPDFTVGTGISPVRHTFLCVSGLYRRFGISPNTITRVPRKQSILNFEFNYSMISETTPEPTVLPPSRIAKRRPFSIAIGVISSTVISTLSPGRHISTSAGRPITPVTSVVLK